MTIHRVFLAAACLAVAAPASAQFTATTVPPRKPENQARVVTNGDTTKVNLTDSTSVSARMSDMKTWVDSAARSLSLSPPVAADSLQPPTASDSLPVPTQPSPPASRNADDSAVFRDGAPAPATASPLPLIALAGVLSILAGAMLRRRR